MRGIKRGTTRAQKYSAGIGYVIIPSDSDRDAYIQKCIRTGTIGILTDDGGILWNVMCNRSDLGFLEFPTVAEYGNKASLGTAVAWVNIPVRDQAVVVAVLDRTDEGAFFQEHQFKIVREFGGGLIEISGKGDTGDLFITASSESDTGSINIKATNTSRSAKINIFAKGEINLDAVGDVNLQASKSLNITVHDPSVDDKSTTISYEKGTGLQYKDEFDNEIIANDSNVQIKAAKKVNLGDGAEPAVLGDTLEQFLSDLVDQIKLITVPTAFGPSGTPINAAAFAALVSTSLARIKSSYSNTD